MASKKKTKGKRYTAEEKQEILDFVSNHNATNGRGGASKASKKYSVSPLTISNWSKKAGSSAPVKPGKKIEPGKKAAGKRVVVRRGRPPATAAAPVAAGADLRSKVLAIVQADITAKSQELAALQAVLKTLKANL